MNSIRSKVGIVILRLLIITLIVIGIPGSLGLKAYAETDMATGLEYTVTDDKVTITGFVPLDGFDGTLDIPAVIDGKSVISIGDEAFAECSALNSITIPNSVTSIGRKAFYKCIALKSIEIPDNVTSIGEYAFFKCNALKSITLPDNVTSIGTGAFSSCESLEEAVLPANLVIIENQLFYSCIKLQSITIPNEVESIGIQAFAHCSALEHVTLGTGVISIGNYAFSSCTSMKQIIIPDSCESIGEQAFANCTSLSSINLGTGVKSIGQLAFESCAIVDIIIPDSCESIPMSAFSECQQLKNITIGKGVKSIGEHAFSHCISLESITIPNGVETIGDFAFINCSALQRIIIPNSITSIGERIFLYNLSIPGETKTIYGYNASVAHDYANTNNIAFCAVPAIIPGTATFDKNPSKQADISTEIINKDPEAALTDIKEDSGSSIGTGNYSINGNILTINKGYLAAHDLGDLQLTLEFDTGDKIILTVSILETIPPSWPIGSTLTAGGTTSSETVLSWTAAQADGGVTDYRIYMDGTIRTTVAGTVYRSEITGLAPFTTYSFRIQAGDGDDNWTTDGPEVAVTTLASASPDNGGDSGNGNDSGNDNGSNNGNSNGNNSSSSGDGAVSPPTQNANFNSGASSQSLAVTVDRENSTVSVGLNKNMLTTAFNGVNASNDGTNTVRVDMPNVQGINSYGLTLPTSFFTADNGSKKIEVTTPAGTMTFSGNMLYGMALDAISDIKINISVADKSKLPENVAKTIGDRPIIEVKLTSGTKAIEWNNPTSPVKIAIPYIPTTEELKNPEHIVIWYIDRAGNVISVPSGRYDPQTGMVTFTTTHFSYYAIAYITKTFDDLTHVAWAKRQIEVLASKGIIKGITEDQYAPNENITRADFLFFLVKALGLDGKIDGNFEDIGLDSYYYYEIAVAKNLGIAKGTGNNRFNPDADITRQDVVVITARVLRMLDKLDQQGCASDLEKFSDSMNISAYALDSMCALVKEGLIAGSGDKLNPINKTTRAEAAALLYRIYNNYLYPNP